MDAWPKIKDDEAVKVGWRTIVTKTFRAPDGREVPYTTKDGVNDFACAVIGLTEDNLVIVAEQFRPGPERVMQEIPGGAGNSGENPEATALRELREETGYTSEDITFLGKIYKDAYTNSVRYYFLARDCQKNAEVELDDTEFVETKLISVDELFANARSAAMTDTEAVFLAYEQLAPLREDG